MREAWRGIFLASLPAASPWGKAGAGRQIATAPRPRLVPGAGQRNLATCTIQECRPSWDNLLLAYRRASQGQRGHPTWPILNTTWRRTCCTSSRNCDATYRPGPYASFHIHEPKRRLISAAPFRDRVVHHALCNLIEPLFERSFIFDSYANRLGKGTHRALDRAQEFARRYPYILQCDVRQFFPSIDHAILRETWPARSRTRRAVAVRPHPGQRCRVLSEVYELTYFPGDELFAALVRADCRSAT